MNCGNDPVSLISNDSDHTSVTDGLSSVPIATPASITSKSNDALNHSEVLSALQQEENMPNNERDESITKVSKPDVVENGEYIYTV